MEVCRDPWPVVVRQPSNRASTPVSYVLLQTSLPFLSCMGLVGAPPGISAAFCWLCSGVVNVWALLKMTARALYFLL